MQNKTKELCLGALFCALTAMCSQLVLNIGPVPVSLNLLAVFLCGALLRPRLALLAQTAYLLLGLIGVPVFSNFGAGPAKLLGPTGGYLIVYPLMAWMVAFALQKWGGRWWIAVLSMLAALAVCYATGTVWLCVQANMTAAQGLAAGVLPFIGFDAAKIALSTLLAGLLKKRVRL